MRLDGSLLFWALQSELKHLIFKKFFRLKSFKDETTPKVLTKFFNVLLQFLTERVNVCFYIAIKICSNYDLILCLQEIL